MQREITVKDVESTLNEYENIDEPIIVKRKNKSDVVILSLKEYQEEMFLNKLEKSKKEYKEGKVHDAKSVFKELREKYEY